MTTHCYAMVRGRVARFTLLNRLGEPLEGASSTLITNGIISATLNEQVDSRASELLRSSPSSDPRVLLADNHAVTGYLADIELCGVDPDLIHMLTGSPRVEDESGDVIGNDVVFRPPAVNFALEIWSRLDRKITGYSYGYTLFPRLRGGRLTGISFENAATTFTVTGATTAARSRWGAGPYGGVGWDDGGWDEMGWDEDGSLAMTNSNLHWRNHLTDFAPNPTCGAQELVFADV